MANEAPAYKVEDRSILLPFYRRLFIDPTLPHLPATLNPNTITHAGHLLNLTGTVILVAMWPTSGWPFLVAAALLQLYLWCDNADGAHARRTNQCSPKGELLDHGLDGLNTVYIGFLSAMGLGLRPTGWLVITFVIPGACAMTYWEQAETGMFKLGLLNQIESLSVLTLVLVVSAVFGTQVWEQVGLFGISAQRAMLLWVVSTILFGMARNVQRVASCNGLGAVAPALGFLALGAAIVGAAAVGAISTVAAVILLTCSDVFFATRMLSVRLRGERPRVEVVFLPFIAAVGALVALHLTGHRTSNVAGYLLAGVACCVFGVQAALEARASVLHVERLPAR